MTFTGRSFLHPFPARMAPDLALGEIAKLPPKSTVVDPMMGSGTVMLSAIQSGHSAIGFDLDPLAVLISNVSTKSIDYERLANLLDNILAEIEPTDPSSLPWIQEGDETDKFLEFWFARKQRSTITSIAKKLHDLDSGQIDTEVNALRLALSRIIVTKEARASLARDTSHSRPHRVLQDNDYDVAKGLRQSCVELVKRHRKFDLVGKAKTFNGDARNMSSLDDFSCDAIVSSPPYLNAIDYLRGHKMSLVWFGFTVPKIRKLRSVSVGNERGTSINDNIEISEVLKAFGNLEVLPDRTKSMIARYASDLVDIAKEAARVLKADGSAFYVMGNSTLKGAYIDNASALVKACEFAGLTSCRRSEREIPENRRYLPVMNGKMNSLSKRMRKEVVLSFVKG